jgi:sugar/nucleoside kinase (ribokinase family)
MKQLPSSDDKYPAVLVGRLPGGFIANATCAAAKLGLRTGYIGWVGDDADGTMLYKDFETWGVDPVGLVKVPGELTPFTLVMTDEQSRRAIILPSMPLYQAVLTSAQIALARETRIVYTYPRDLLWCEELGGRRDPDFIFALDIESVSPMRGQDLQRAIHTLTNVGFVSESSLALIGVSSLHDLVGAERWVIMTAGSRGAYGLEDGLDEPIFQPARPVDVVDTTGAGDCFHAALLAARLDGATLAEALFFANAAAAIKVQYRGARGGLPTRAEVLATLSS